MAANPRTHSPTADRSSRAADQAFARFCRNRNPNDLAEVFDRTAPRLILVAMHLTRDAAAAEDLLQTTFLEAIAASERCDPRRPVLPWLLTILTRRAHNERRRRSRDRGRSSGVGGDGAGGAIAGGTIAGGTIVGGASRGEKDNSLDPARAAQQRETFEHVASAIDGMSKPYREVLALRFVHGLTAAEIARALDRPVGTVHAQLHRGAERLREILPKGLAGILAVLLGAERGLAAVRTSVLAGAALTGGIAIKKVAVAAAGLLSVLALWVVQSGSGSPAEEARGEATEAIAPTLGGESEPDDATKPDRVGPAATRTEIGKGSTAAAKATMESTFTGRVVAAESGAPLVGARVRMKIYGPALPDGWQDPAPVFTGADGRYRASFVPPRSTQVELWIEHEGRVPALWTNWDVAAGFVEDQGDIKLLRGTETRVRVVDTEGLPVAGYFVVLAGLPRLSSNLPSPYVDATAHTDAEGRIPARRLYPGTWRVNQDWEFGARLEPGAMFVVAHGERQKNVTVRVKWSAPERTVSGRVVDQDGRAVAGLLLDARQGTMQGHRRIRSMPNGTFRFGSLDPNGGALRFLLPPHRLQLEDYAPRGRKFEVVAPLETVPIGTKDLVVVVRELEPVPVQIKVIDPVGKPVERFTWSCAPVQRHRGRTILHDNFKLGRNVIHPGGVARRGDLLPGSYVLVVRPENPRLALRFAQEFSISHDGRCKVLVRLDRRRAWSVRVVDNRGESVEGVRVELLQAITPFHLGKYIVDRDKALNPGGRSNYPSLRLQTGITDKKGFVSCSTAPSLGSAGVRVTGDSILPEFVELRNVPSGSKPFLVRVRRGATIEGVIRPAKAIVAWGPTKRQRAAFALLAGETRAQKQRFYMPRVSAVQITTTGKPRHRPSAAVNEDGTFRFASVPPGSWRLILYCRGRKPHVLDELHDLRAGDRRHLDLSVQDLSPASLRGTAMLDGMKVARGRIRVGTAQADIRNGAFQLPRLSAGRYRPTLEMGEGPRLQLDKTIELHAGQTSEHTLFFVRPR